MVDKITMMDLNKALHELGARPTRGEIKDMIWEVDDDLDGAISEKEFDTTYRRCIMENSSLEPRKFYNLMVFLMFDKEERGKITAEDTL